MTSYDWPPIGHVQRRVAAVCSDPADATTRLPRATATPEKTVTSASGRALGVSVAIAAAVAPRRRMALFPFAPIPGPWVQVGDGRGPARFAPSVVRIARLLAHVNASVAMNECTLTRWKCGCGE